MNLEIKPEGNHGPSQRVFLSAVWRDLVMLNYQVDPNLLLGYVPIGTELDSFEEKTFVSLVGFRFLHTKLFGLAPIPFHACFEEVNLRFYVRRREGGEDRRGVVFLREIVPRRAVAWTARLAYGENYVRYSMRHDVITSGGAITAEYSWMLHGQWCTLRAQACGTSRRPGEGSLEQYITEHYWGYAARRKGGSLEYHVSHVPWNVWACTSAGFVGNANALYGPELQGILQRPPDSAFIADGSPVVVHAGERIV
jgi:uncharacterized protein YqjF (DUF2071 family)